MASWRIVPLFLLILLVVQLQPSLAHEGPSAATSGTDVDGGPTFDTATRLEPSGLYHAYLPGGSDRDDYYRFDVQAGEPINIELRNVLWGGSLPAPDNEVRLSFRLFSPHGVLLDTPNTNQGDTRLMVSAAPVSGAYRFHVTEDDGGFRGAYTFCFLRPPDEPHPCPDLGIRRQDVLYGGTLAGAERTRVLLVPPTHGDLGNPFGPTALDYLDAALSGIHEWVRVLHEFATDYPEYDHLKRVQVEIVLFDGTQVHTDFDIVIVYVESGGTQFRGAATACVNPPRCIVLSLFSMSPRSGQSLPDYPEYNDLEHVVKHEFAHVWGLGHTQTWTAEHGPDLMNSPAPFVYGDGNPVGDGGERTPKGCISTLNLYVAARLFQHLDGLPKVTGGSFALPAGIPYTVYC